MGEWNDVKKKLPPPYQDVLVRLDGFTRVAWYQEIEKVWRISGSGEIVNSDVVAWMPLPKPPPARD